MRIGGDAFIITSNCLRVLFAYMKFYTDPALPSPREHRPLKFATKMLPLCTLNVLKW